MDERVGYEVVLAGEVVPRPAADGYEAVVMRPAPTDGVLVRGALPIFLSLVDLDALRAEVVARQERREMLRDERFGQERPLATLVDNEDDIHRE